MRTGGIQFCNVQNFSCALFKIDFNFAPLAVVVCLVFVDCDGDLLFSANDLLLSYSHRADGIVLHQQSRQVIHSLAVGFLRTTRCGEFKVCAQIIETFAVFHIPGAAAFHTHGVPPLQILFLV